MKKGVVRLPNEKRGCTASQWKRGRTASQWKKGLYGFPMALIRDVTAKEREIHSSIIVLLDVRKEATMCIIPVIPISKFTRILTSTGKLFAGEGSLQNNVVSLNPYSSAWSSCLRPEKSGVAHSAARRLHLFSHSHFSLFSRDSSSAAPVIKKRAFSIIR